MSLNFEIAEPGQGASELAYKTRAALSKFIANAAPLLEVPALAELSKEVIRSLKDEGASAFKTQIERHGSPAPEYHPLRNVLLAYGLAFNAIVDLGEVDYRQFSYKFEGLIRAVGAHLHSIGLKLDNEAQILLMAVLNKDHTSITWDAFRCERLGMERWQGPNTWNFLCSCMHQFELQDVWLRLSQFNLHDQYSDPVGMRGFREQFSEWFNVEAENSWYGVHPRGPIHGPWTSPVLYLDADGPWVAGLLTPQDTLRMRFTRVRLGSWLTTLGMADDDVRGIVERVKSESAGEGTFLVYPNDSLFGTVYQAMANESKGVRSCMAGPTEEYNTWDDIHPTDVYSSAHFGTGDNHLALFTYKVGENRIGRGIVNTESMRCVRWYGSVHGERALKRIGIKRDVCALENSWLALVQSGKRMIAPYLDGDIEYVKADQSAGRLYITQDGATMACETSGVLGISEVYCIDDDDYHDEEECTYQSESNSWISPDCDDWRCPVIGEWSHPSSRATIYLDGEEVEVSERVAGRMDSYLTMIDPTEDMLDEHGEWEDTDDGEELVSTDDVPANYTGRGRWATVQANKPYTPPPVQTFSWDTARYAQAAASAPVLAADVAQQLPAAMSIYAQAGCTCTDCRIERGELL